MNNADKFKQIFNLYATELWAMSEKNFLAWLNAEYDVSDTNAGDLISRRAAIDAISAKPAIHGSEGSWYHWDDVKDALEELPTIDTVPVVRYKDCKYGPVYDGIYFTHGECEFCQSRDDFFCVDGERREK